MTNIFDDEEKAAIAIKLAKAAAKHGIPMMVFTSKEALILAADNMTLGASLKEDILKPALMAYKPSPSGRVH